MGESERAFMHQGRRWISLIGTVLLCAFYFYALAFAVNDVRSEILLDRPFEPLKILIFFVASGLGYLHGLLAVSLFRQKHDARELGLILAVLNGMLWIPFMTNIAWQLGVALTFVLVVASCPIYFLYPRRKVQE